MILVLGAALFGVLLLVGGSKGLDVFWTLIWNFVTFIVTVFLLSKNFNIFVVTIVSCVVISMLTLFFQNGTNVKTICAFVSVLLVTVCLIIVVLIVSYKSGIQGFGDEYNDINESYGYSGYIGINMIHLAIAVMIIALIGAILDTALSIASATYEVHVNNKELSSKELFASSMNIGKDILGTTINTLFFIFAGDSLTLMILFKEHYSFETMINSKIFSQELLQILFSTAGCILIIPVTAAISSYGIVRLQNIAK